MTYLLTGATGFIGRQVVELLLQEGHAVNYLARRRSADLDSRASFYHWQTFEAPPLDSMGRVDAVIHLAGEPVAQRWTKDVKQRIYDSRVRGTANLVAALRALKHKPSVLVSASAIGYYGERGDELLTEGSAPGTDFLADVCVDWEREAFLATELGLRVAAVRISIVLGQGGGALGKMLPLFRLGLGGKLGDGRQWMSWVHVQDLARLFLYVASTPELTGPVNGATANPLRNSAFTQTLASAVGRPALFPVPKVALRLALGEMGDSTLQSTRLAPSKAEAAGFRFDYPELKQALKAVL